MSWTPYRHGKIIRGLTLFTCTMYHTRAITMTMAITASVLQSPPSTRIHFISTSIVCHQRTSLAKNTSTHRSSCFSLEWITREGKLHKLRRRSNSTALSTLEQKITTCLGVRNNETRVNIEAGGPSFSKPRNLTRQTFRDKKT